MNAFKSCYECQDRHLNCHSSCELYNAEKDKYDEVMKRKAEANFDARINIPRWMKYAKRRYR